MHNYELYLRFQNIPMFTFEQRAEHFHRVRRTALRDQSDPEFGVQTRNADHDQHDKVRDKETRATRFVDQIRKAPNVPEANTIADACEQKLRFNGFKIFFWGRKFLMESFIDA